MIHEAFAGKNSRRPLPQTGTRNATDQPGKGQGNDHCLEFYIT